MSSSTPAILADAPFLAGGHVWRNLPLSQHIPPTISMYIIDFKHDAAEIRHEDVIILGKPG